MNRKIIAQSENFKKPFPSRLRALLAETGETQTELAAAIGKVRQVVSNYCLGKTEPELDTLAAIAKHYCVTVDYLVGAENGKQHDIDNTSGLTGLNEETIEKLISIREKSEGDPATPKAMSAKTTLESIDLFFLLADVENIGCLLAELGNAIFDEIGFVQSEHGKELEAIKDRPEMIIKKWDDFDNMTLTEYNKRRELQQMILGRRYSLIKGVEDFLDDYHRFMVLNPKTWEEGNGEGEE